MKQLFHKIVLQHIIAPHGLTDIIHAIEYKKVPKMLLSYSATCLTTCVLHKYPRIIDVCFLFCSTLHFRIDMPRWGIINNMYAYTLQMIQSMVLVLWFLLAKPYDVFFYFMCILHVPNHYKNSFVYLKVHPYMTAFLFSVFHILVQQYSQLSMNRYHLLVVEAIVMGHIVYHELFVRKLIIK